MKNNILIYANDLEYLNFQVNNYIKALNINDECIEKISYDHNIEDIITSACTLNLFGDKKIIVVEDCTLFSDNKNKEECNLLEKYLNNFNPNTYIIFTLVNEKVDTRKKIYIKIKESGQVIECGKIDENTIQQFIKQYLEERSYSINSILAKRFINIVGSNISNIRNELDKIISYKNKPSEIKEEDIIGLTVNTSDKNIFLLIDKIIEKDLSQSISLYHEFLNKNEEPIKIIAMLANKYRLLYQCQILYQEGKNKYQISEILGVHSYPVSLAINLLYKYDAQELKQILKSLYQLDLDIKTGKINDSLALELFIIKNSE